MSPRTDAELVEELVRAGKWAEAVERLRAGGQLLRAQGLLEKIWDFTGAARLAAERGDRPDALRLFIDARDQPAAAAVLQGLLAAPSGDELARAAEVCEHKHLYAEAARLRERAGKERLARDLYARAGRHREAGRLDERAGLLREAGQSYERALAADGAREARAQDQTLGQAQAIAQAQTMADAGSARREAAGVEERRGTHLALGRVLEQLGHHEAAVRHLQRGLGTTAEEVALDEKIGRAPASSEAPDASEARDRLALALLHLGLPDAAAAIKPPGGAHLPSLPEDLEARLLAGRYLVERLLGSGGMGRVYLARDRATDELVAVKLVAAPVDARSREGYRRFLREARIVSGLHHPHLVAVRAVVEEHALLVMEYLPGGTLADRTGSLADRAGTLADRPGTLADRPGTLADRPGTPANRPDPPRLVSGPALSLPTVRTILRQLVAALEAAHLHGVVHRDLKPANVFFSAAGEARLGDFGVAHLQDLGATLTGGFVGTLAYMSPEQITGAPVTWATDLYALGVTAFQMVTGRLPFTGPDLIGQHLGEAPPPPSSLRPDGDRRFDALVLRLLAKDPAARHDSLAALRRALDAIPLDDADEPALRTAATIPGEADADAPWPSPSAPPERYRIESELERSATSALYRGIDERLGRAVVVERFEPGALDGEAGEPRRCWLRAMARHGGPELQRVLRIELAAARVIYEDTPGVPVAPSRPSLPRAAAARLLLDALRALAGPHAEGVAHGGVTHALVWDQARAVLRVAGFAPAAGSPAQDLADLRALVAAVGRDVADLPGESDAATLASWARGAISSGS